VSRQFVHAFHNDYIAFGAGNAGGLDGGPQTTLMLFKLDSTTDHGLVVGRNAGLSNVWSVNPASDNKAYYSASGFAATVTLTAGVWYLLGLTKANGSAAVRAHLYDYSAGPPWTHTDYGTISDSSAGPVTEYRVGWIDSGDRLDGKLAAVGLWGSVLSDGQIEGLTTSLAAWKALSPAALWGFNQASTATPVPDLTGGGADQTDISGTSVSADEPASWSYSIGTTVNIIGQVVETDTAQPMGRLKTRAVGQTSENDLAQPMGRLKTRLLGQVIEQDFALPLANTPIVVGRGIPAVRSQTSTVTVISGSEVAVR
jgi:hypothetical protein